MEKTRKIMRSSIFTFLQNYNTFTTKAALLAFPFSAAILIAQARLDPVQYAPIQSRLAGLFDAAGFPKSSEFFTILNQKLSQTIASSIFTLPFTLSFFLASKAFVIRSLTGSKPGSVYGPVLVTYIWNSILILSANATVFSLMSFAFSALEWLRFDSPNRVLFLSAAGAVLYSIVVANAVMISNLALVLAGAEGFGGHLAAIKACVLIKGRTPTALSLALPLSLGLASIEALFQYRVAKVFHENGGEFLGGASMAVEAVLICYLYSIVLVLETVVNVKFLESCREAFLIDQLGRRQLRGSKNGGQKLESLGEEIV